MAKKKTTYKTAPKPVQNDRFTIDLLKDPPPCPDCGKKRDWIEPTGSFVHAVCFGCGKEQVFVVIAYQPMEVDWCP